MLTKKDAKMAQGLAIIGMVMLHLFCRLEDLPYDVHLHVGNTPFIYYLGLFGDMCIPVFCFCSGYAQSVLSNRDQRYNKNRYNRILKFIEHFWIVLILFSIIGVLVHSHDIPIDIKTFLGNLFLYNLSYNGAWWFVDTYIILILMFPIMKYIVERLDNRLSIILSVLVYGISYICELRLSGLFSNSILSWIYRQVYLFGRTQLPFVIGMLCYRYRLIEKLKEIIYRKNFLKPLLIIIPICMLILHGIVQSLIVSPFTGLVTLICFHLWRKPKWIESVLLFLGRHSTNIWLTHMFFYLVLFKGLVFIVKEPILILICMFVICIIVSYIINGIEGVLKRILEQINTYFKRKC